MRARAALMLSSVTDSKVILSFLQVLQGLVMVDAILAGNEKPPTALAGGGLGST